jgi:serpin B
MKTGTIIALLFASTCLAQDAAMLAAREANQHAFDLFQLFRQMTKGNFCFSPYSGHRVAAMLAEGAKGKTQEELIAMAHLATDAAGRAARASALRQELSVAAGNGLILEVANSIWAPDGHAFLPPFEKLAKEQFGALARLLPHGDPVGSAALVNRWIRDKTRGRIGSLVGPASFDRNGPTVLVVNAVYLKAAWEERFDPARTKPRVFTQGSGNISQLPTMLQTSMFEYCDSEAWQCLEMRFKGAEFAMRFLLPRAEAGRAAIETALSPAAWDKVVQTSTSCEVNFMLPRFGFSTQLDLKGLWHTLGARDVFEAQKADLTAMVSQTPCWTGQVLHEATIEVNEIGAEATAATTAVDPFGEAPEPPKRRKVSFIANHPFLWVIQHRRTGLILFMGRFAGE